MIQLGFGLFILGLIGLLVIESHKQAKKDAEREERAVLKDELEQAKNELEDVDLKENVVDLKAKLKKRTKAVSKKEDKLNKN